MLELAHLRARTTLFFVLCARDEKSAQLFPKYRDIVHAGGIIKIPDGEMEDSHDQLLLIIHHIRYNVFPQTASQTSSYTQMIRSAKLGQSS